jgi:hypothetical protein
MKTKSILLLVACAIITLSFSISTVNTKGKVKTESPKANTSEPIGGLAIEDKP